MIVRRILKCGAEAGRYFEITKKTTKGYYGRTLRKKSEFFIAETLDNFKEISVISVQVSNIEFEALKHVISFHHDLSTQWKRVLTNKPEVIKLWNKTDVMYIFPAIIKKRFFGRVPNIYVEIKSREYEPK